MVNCSHLSVAHSNLRLNQTHALSLATFMAVIKLFKKSLKASPGTVTITFGAPIDATNHSGSKADIQGVLDQTFNQISSMKQITSF